MKDLKPLCVVLCLVVLGFGNEPKEILLESSNEPSVLEIRVGNSNGKKTIFYNDTLLEYNDPTILQIVSPVWESRTIMKTKRILKPMSLTALAIGIGLIAYSLPSIVVDGGAEEAWKFRKPGLILGCFGFAAFAFQIPLSNLAISTFNKRTKSLNGKWEP